MAGGRPTEGGPDKRVEIAPFNPQGTTRQRADMVTVQTVGRPNFAIPATKVMLQAFDQNVRFTLDGSAPTPTFGFRITAARDPIMVTFGPDTLIQVVEEAATATLVYCWGQ